MCDDALSPKMDDESWRNLKESTGKEFEVVRACDAKRSKPILLLAT